MTATARCNCSGQVCSCRLTPGDNITITGAGSASDPFVISGTAAGGGTDGIPAGVYMPFGGTAAPAGWLMCNGQAVNRATFANLFAAIGTRFGAGDGATTFNVPNMVNRVPIGAGGRYSAGSSGGSDTVTLTVANLPPHAHQISHTHTINHTHSVYHDHGGFNTQSGGTHTHKLQVDNSDGGSNATVRQAGASGHDTAGPVETTGGHVHSINVPPNRVNTDAIPGVSSGGTSAINSATNPSGGAQMTGASFTNVPPYVASNFIIKT